jgi:ABC-2 type transport system permease protein
MRIQIIITDFVASVRTWMRSKGTLFWTLAFPVILILIFGAIFSGVGDVEYDLYVQDLDDSEMSQNFLDILEETGVIKIKTVSSTTNVDSYIKKNNIKRLLVIPRDYETRITHSFSDPNVTVNLTYYFDPSEQSTNQVVHSVISNVLQSINMELTQGRNIVGINEISTITEDFGFIDFFLPGMIGFTIMQTCIYGSIERNTKFRKDGILRKLLTTPITRTEWIFSKMLFMLFLSFISTMLIIIVGVGVYGINININILTVITVIGTSFLFSGLGMLIGRFVKEEETADTAGGAISFPMMFLAGTFFPLDQMPAFLQSFARVLPLYYVNEALRNSMIYLNEQEAIINTIFVITFASVFFIAGVLLTKWKED